MDNKPEGKVRWVTHCPDPDSWSALIARQSKRDASGCLIWTGVVDRRGYGKFRVRVGGRRTLNTGAHRAAWLSRVGDIAPGLVLDHLCRNTLCVDVSHLEPVTNSVNVLRGDHSAKAGRSGRRPGSEPQSCPIHARDDGYIYTDKRGYSRWTCRPCRARRVGEWKARKTALATK